MIPRNADKLVLAVLRSPHGPMTDPQLVWWLKHFGVTKSRVLRARRKLTEEKKVVWARKVRQNSRGQLLHVWEAAE